jgi:hypothetical protein
MLTYMLTADPFPNTQRPPVGMGGRHGDSLPESAAACTAIV